MRALQKQIDWAERLKYNENQLESIRTRLSNVKQGMLSLRTEVLADEDATTEDTDAMAEVNTLVTDQRWVDFMTLLDTYLG